MTDIFRWLMHWLGRPSPAKYTTVIQIATVRSIIDIVPGEPK